MKKISSVIALLCAASLGFQIAGCGSGGSTFTAAQPGVTTPALNTTVSGVAATGAPIVGNAFLKDSSTPAVVKVVAIHPDGTFAFDVKDLKAPFILRAEGLSAGAPHILHSFAAGTGTANITPLSEVAMANAAGGADPASLYANPAPAMLQTVAANLPAAIAVLQAKLKPLMDQYGASINPVYDSFAANHTGLDAMLDAVKITLAAGNVVMTNKISNAIMLNAPVNDINAGTLNMGNMPPAPVPTPVPAPTSSLYDTNCAGCHGPLATSAKRGATAARIQAAIAANIAGKSRFSSLSAAEIQAIADALAIPATTAPAPPTPAAPTIGSTPAPTQPDGAALYTANCSGCHGALATSAKQGVTVARIQAAIAANIAGKSRFATLTTAELQAIADALAIPAAPAPSPTPTPAPEPTPAPSPTPAPADGATLYADNCAGCHGPLASSDKLGATAARTQTAITGNVGGMGYLSTLSAAQVEAIAGVLATTAPAPAPAPSPACGSCHAIPPATGQHAKHRSRSCATCHGSGYSTTTVNAATHNNGVKEVGGTSGWDSTSRTCTNSCHGRESW